MDRSTQIMGGSFRQGLNSEVDTFSPRLDFQPSPLYKSNIWLPPIFVSCLLIGPNGFTTLFRSSSMVLSDSRRSMIVNIKQTLAFSIHGHIAQAALACTSGF